MNKKIYKLTSILIIFFTIFLINKNVVFADTITCNYNVSTGADGAIDVILSYEGNDASSNKAYPKVEYKATNGLDIKIVAADFQIYQIPTDNGGCPSKLYSLDSTYSKSSYENVEMKFYLNEDAANTAAKNSEKFDKGTLLSYNFSNGTDYTKKSSCEYYENLGGTQSTSDKLIIYYDKSGNTTPEISYKNKYSTDSKKFIPNFKSSDLSTCPVKVYGVESLENGVEKITFYLDEATAKKISNSYITFSNTGDYGDPDSNTVKKTDVNGLDPNSTSITINCSDYSALHTIYTLILIVAPIIVIVLGSIDYAKAVMASNLEKMEKFKKKFPMRLTALIILFLIPLLIKLILSLNSSLNDTMLYCVVNGKDAEIKLNSAQLDDDGSNGVDTGSLKYTPKSADNDSNNTSNNTSNNSTTDTTDTTQQSSTSYKGVDCSACDKLPTSEKSACLKNCKSNTSSSSSEFNNCSKCETIPYASAKAACEDANGCKTLNKK